MANNQTQPAKDNLQEEEERLEDAYEHINELHLQLRQLRLALPRMLAPIAAKHPSPQAFHGAVMKSIQDTSKEITGFKEAYTSETTKAILREAAESRKANPKGIRPWIASEHPDWIEVKKRRQPADSATGTTAAESITTDNSS